ncbi:MAG: amphi-Trp domain-containing protein [Limisphaerales bacterium]
MTKRNMEKFCSTAAFVARLRRLADALEAGQPCTVQVAGERVAVPTLAIFSIEHERDAAAEELEFQLKWKRKPKPRPDIAPSQVKDRGRSKHEN